MSLADDVNSMFKHTKDVYDSLEALGATMPTNKNLENLGTAFDSLSLKPSYDPENPTVDGLKAALDAGDYAAFPAGTEIPDEYNGQSNPLIVAQYLDSSNNSAYGGAEGVILIRKYVEPKLAYGSAPYASSYVNTYLKTTYMDRCSEAIKPLVSDIDIVIDDTINPTKVKWFSMSIVELGGSNSSQLLLYGIYWDYWKQKTGIITPTNSLNKLRCGYDRAGNEVQYYLRTGTRSTYDYNQGGALKSGGTNMTLNSGVLPACFVSKN